MSARSSLGHSVYRNHRNLDIYMDRVERGESPVEEVINLGDEDLKTQFIARSLGDGKTLSLERYLSQFGSTLESDHGDTLQRLTNGGLIARSGDSLHLTEVGKLLYDLVTLSFYPARAKAWLLERLESYQVGAAPSEVAISGLPANR